MIAVARDYEGLKTAALERLEEAFQEKDVERTLRRATEGPCNAEDVIAACAPKQTLAAGYYARADYLFWLAGVMETVSFRPHELSVTEAEGLRVVAQARAQFQREHPPCPNCGAPNRRHTLQCRECMFDMKKRGTA